MNPNIIFIIVFGICIIISYVIIGVGKTWFVIVSPALFLRKNVRMRLRTTSLENLLEEIKQGFANDEDALSLTRACATGTIMEMLKIGIRRAVKLQAKKNPHDEKMIQLEKLSDGGRLFVTIRNIIFLWPIL